MEDIPVVVITYNRAKHTLEVLKALRDHDIKNIYIFSDAPKRQEDVEPVLLTRRLIHSVDWTNPKIIERTENFGLARSIVSAVNEVFQKYDRLILLEDDCVPQRYFFDFMNKCLTKYEHNERIFGINGYTAAIPDVLLKDYPFDIYFYPRIGSWGWATWKRAWAYYEPNLAKVYNQIITDKIDIMQGGTDIPGNVEKLLSGELKDVWTLNWVLSVYLNRGYYVYPVASQIQNIGFDGTGVHCGKSQVFSNFSNDKQINSLPDEVIHNQNLIDNYNRIFGKLPERPKADKIQKARFTDVPKTHYSQSKTESSRGQKELSIVHINTHDVAGGAAKVAWRFAELQRDAGHNSNMLVGNKKSRSKYSFEFAKEPDMFIQHQCRRKGQIDYEFQGSYNLITNPLVRNADILHLHNLHGYYFNPFSLSALSHVKPVVWTLHDMHSVTGHCAYSCGCEGWRNNCERCQHLNIPYEIPIDTAKQIVQDKKLVYDHSSLQIVVPSVWLKKIAEKSILRNHPIELIYNGVDTDTFRPYDKKQVRRKFGIPENALVIGAVAAGGTLSNYWKGGKYTLAVLDTLQNKLTDCVFVNIGGDGEASDDPRIINIARIDDESELAQAYSALDIFLFTSVADNCPLVVLEALACGVPMVTVDTGGIPELVRHGVNGYITSYEDIAGLAQLVLKLAGDSKLRESFSSNARQWAVTKFEHKLIVEQYQNLYRRYIQEINNKPKRVKLFPLDKVPKIVQSQAFIKAEESKKMLSKADRTSRSRAKFLGTSDSFATGMGTSAQNRRPARCKKVKYLVSAIVSTYNSERFIRGCIEDLERQTIADVIEIVVVNSGSQQNEEAIVREFQEKYDNIKYIRTEKRESIYKAWNRGIEIATGKYIANANTDDRRRQDAMEIMVGVLESNLNVGLVYADQILTCRENETFENCTSSEEYEYPDYKDDLFLEIGWCKMGSQPMWRASLHKEIGLFDENFEIAGDYDFLLRVCDKYKCYHIPEFLGMFYRSPDTVTHRKSFRLNQIENPLAKARVLFRKGVRCFEEGKYKEAFRHLGMSLRFWSSREAAKYLEIVSERIGKKKISADKAMEHLPSIYEVPGSTLEEQTENFELEKGYLCSGDNGTIVSAIIYPDKKWPIRDCLESLKRQTIAERLEIIVLIDSKVPDEDKQTVEQFKRECDNIKCIVVEDTETISAATNRAVRTASGKYIGLFNGEYRYRSDSLELMVKKLDSEPDGAAVFINGQLNQGAGRSFASKVGFSHDRLLRENYIFLPVLWQKQVHEQFGYFDEAFVLCGCYEFWLRIAQRYKFLHLDIELRESQQREIGHEEDAEKEYIRCFETAVIKKAYQYANLNSILIGEKGVSETEPFSKWCETSIIRKKREEKCGGVFDGVSKKSDFRVDNATPLLSVIVVTYNKQADLFDNIKGLNKQTEKNFELIVVNNGQSIERLTQKDDSLMFDLCYVESKDNYGPSLGRNIGAQFARAPYIAFLDDDAVADENFVRNIVSHFRNYDIFALRGKVLPKIGYFNSIFLDLGDEIRPSTIEQEGNCAFRRDIFFKRGGFDEFLFHGEGSDLAYRIYMAEGERLESVLYFPDVVIYHDSYEMGQDNIEKITRTNTIGQLLFQKDPAIKSYLNYFGSFYPDNKDEVEKSYNQLMTNVSFLQEKHPEEAVKWAEKAIKVKPEAYTCRYILGSLYVELERYEEGLVTFDKIHEEISEALNEGNWRLLKLSFSDSTAIGLCYCDSCLKLAGCYSGLGRYAEAKKVYANLLNDSHIGMSAEQKKVIELEMSELDKPQTLDTREMTSVSQNNIVQSECDVSIVLCTKNRAQLLDKMLASIEDAAEGISYEIIIVEGGSSDNTVDVLCKHGVTQVYNEAQHLGAGRHSWPELFNFGFSKARGRWGMFASDDIVFGKGCISKAVEYLNRQNDTIAGGIFFFKNINERPTVEESDRGKFFVGMGREYRVLMNYGLVRMDYFRQVSGLGEEYKFYYADSDLCCKLYDIGKQLIPLPESFVVHNNAPDEFRESNAQIGECDRVLYCERWIDVADEDSSHPGRLIWQEELADMFKLPDDLKDVTGGIQYFWQGIAYMQHDRFEDALMKFSKAMEQGCSHWKVLWCAVRAAFDCKQFAFAEKGVRIVLKLAPQFAQAKELLAKLKSAQTQMPSSIDKSIVRPSDIHEFERRISPLTKQKHDEILDWAQDCEKNSEQFEQPQLFENSDDPIVRQGYELVNDVKSKFAGRYKHLEQLRILVHIPSLDVSPGGYSLFTNLAVALEFIGIHVQPLGWNERIEDHLEGFRPTVFITNDSESYLSRINWDAIKRYRGSNVLKVGLTASVETCGRPLAERIEWAGQQGVDFYYNFRSSKYLEQSGEYNRFYENGYKIFSIEFAANPLIHYPVPGIESDLNYVFLASVNQPKWQRYFAYLTEILSRYPGFLDGPGWPFIGKKATNLNKDRYLYARAMAGLNLHLDEQIDRAGELNERTYILAACGVPQLLDNPKLLPDRFDGNGLFIADSPKEYFRLFEYILANPNEAKRRALIAQREVFAGHTWFHRAEGFVLDLMRDCFAQEQLPKRVTRISNVPGETSGEISKVGGLIFSKDRAMQVQATIESFLVNCKDSNRIELNVLYKVSNQLHKRQYDKLIEKFRAVTFIEEGDFREQVPAFINSCEYVLFLVDDNLFVKGFSISEIIKCLRDNNGAIGFSLRLGRNTTYCYTRDVGQALPVFEQACDGVLKYGWEKGSFDFGYPLELSSSVYRCEDIKELLSRLQFENPNMLEELMAANAEVFGQVRDKLLCFEQSVAFCNPVNMVQTLWSNRVGTDVKYSPENLAKIFDNGMSIDVKRYSSFVPDACHQEVPLYFKQNRLKPAASNRSIDKTLGAKPLFSIVMPNYNKGRFIGQAIESVLNQTFKDWELLVIDDCSSDNSVEVVRRYLGDRRIRLFEHEQRRGVIGAMKTAVSNLRSDYFGILDSDDCLVSHAVETMYRWHEKLADTGFIYSQFASCDENLVRQKEGFCAELPEGKTNLDEYVVSHFRTFKLRDYLKTSGFDESVLYMEDIDIVYRMEEVTKLKFVDECLYLYRQLPDSQSHSKDKINIAIMSRAKSRINAIKRRSEALSESSGQDFEELFYKAIEDLKAKYEDVTQYFVILRQLYEKGFFSNLELPGYITSLVIEDVLLWLAANVDVRFDKLFKVIGKDEGRTKERPLVSVNMVTYNCEGFIRQAIDSVLTQSYKNFELVIVDDGSTDGTREIIKSYCDNRIKYIYTPHKNCASARNRAVADSKGEYLLCVDSDDFIASDYIEKMVEYAERYPESDYFYPSELILMGESDKMTGDKWEYPDVPDSRLLPHFLFDNGYLPIPNPGSMKRRSLFDKVGGYDELETVEDFAFLCKNALKIRFKRVDNGLRYYYRRLSSGLSLRFEARDRITADILNDMISIYPSELLCPKIADITDTDLKKKEYCEYLVATFDKHSQGYHLVEHGEYFARYRDYYRKRLEEIEKAGEVVGSME